MPNWQPNRNPVRWNHDAANRAVWALNQAASELEQLLAERQRSAGVATADWQGRYRVEFDAHLDDAARRARALAEEYRATARRINDLSQQASDEQRRRDNDQRRWEDEKRDEDRRERERQEREARERQRQKK